MFCTQCGLAHEDAARFCSQCGKSTGVYGAAGPSGSGYTPSGFNAFSGTTYSPGNYKPLVRMREGAWLGGVCAGLARYWDTDPALVRIAFVALAVCPILPAIIPYIVCWIIMPREAMAMSNAAAPPPPSNFSSPGFTPGPSGPTAVSAV